MKPTEREKKARAFNYALAFIFYLDVVAALGTLIFFMTLSMDDNGPGAGMYVFMVLIGLLGVFLSVAQTNNCKRMNANYARMHKEAPVVKANYERVKEELSRILFSSTKHFSSFGYEFFEMRDDFEAPDNNHIEIDDRTGKIVTYTLLPFDFQMLNCSQISECTIKKELSEDGNTLTALVVLVSFTNGHIYGLSAIDNKSCPVNSEEYKQALTDAQAAQTYIKKMKEIFNG